MSSQHTGPRWYLGFHIAQRGQQISTRSRSLSWLRLHHLSGGQSRRGAAKSSPAEISAVHTLTAPPISAPSYALAAQIRPAVKGMWEDSGPDLRHETVRPVEPPNLFRVVEAGSQPAGSRASPDTMEAMQPARRSNRHRRLPAASSSEPLDERGVGAPPSRSFATASHEASSGYARRSENSIIAGPHSPLRGRRRGAG